MKINVTSDIFVTIQKKKKENKYDLSWTFDLS